MCQFEWNHFVAHAASLLRKLVDEVMPVQYEWVLEPDTYSVLVSRGYRSDGQPIFETKGWQVWTNLSGRFTAG